MRFRLSSAAERDLAEIKVFTLERWGREQWHSHRGDLADCFERIAAEPGLGRRRDVFRPGMRSVPCGSHVVFYVELDGGVIGIVRLLHARRNASALRWSEGME